MNTPSILKMAHLITPHFLVTTSLVRYFTSISLAILAIEKHIGLEKHNK